MTTTKTKRPTKPKPNPARTAGAKCGRELLKLPSVKRLVKAADTLGLKEYTRHVATWKNSYRDLTTIEQRNDFLRAVAEVVTTKSGIAFRLP